MSLQLRRPNRSDLDYMVDWLDDPSFRHFVFGQNDKSQQGGQMVALIGGAIALPMATAGFLLCETADEGPVGVVAIQDLSWRNRGCLMSAFLAGNARNDSNLIELYELAIAYCFNELNLHRVSIRVSDADSGSQRACEAAHARHEARLRGYMQLDGAPVDMHIYGVLRQEFEARSAASAGQ